MAEKAVRDRKLSLGKGEDLLFVESLGTFEQLNSFSVILYKLNGLSHSCSNVLLSKLKTQNSERKQYSALKSFRLNDKTLFSSFDSYR